MSPSTSTWKPQYAKNQSAARAAKKKAKKISEKNRRAYEKRKATNMSATNSNNDGSSNPAPSATTTARSTPGTGVPGSGQIVAAATAADGTLMVPPTAFGPAMFATANFSGATIQFQDNRTFVQGDVINNNGAPTEAVASIQDRLDQHDKQIQDLGEDLYERAEQDGISTSNFKTPHRKNPPQSPKDHQKIPPPSPADLADQFKNADSPMATTTTNESLGSGSVKKNNNNIPNYAVTTIQSAWRRRYLKRRTNIAVATIQSAWRRRYLKRRTNIAVATIQSAWRRRYQKRRTNSAATTIQSAWRRYVKQRTDSAATIITLGSVGNIRTKATERNNVVVGNISATKSTGRNNVVIGDISTTKATGRNNVVIGNINSTKATGRNNVVIGNISTTKATQREKAIAKINAMATIKSALLRYVKRRRARRFRKEYIEECEFRSKTMSLSQLGLSPQDDVISSHVLPIGKFGCDGKPQYHLQKDLWGGIGPTLQSTITKLNLEGYNTFAIVGGNFNHEIRQLDGATLQSKLVFYSETMDVHAFQQKLALPSGIAVRMCNEVDGNPRWELLFYQLKDLGLGWVSLDDILGKSSVAALSLIDSKQFEKAKKNLISRFPHIEDSTLFASMSLLLPGQEEFGLNPDGSVKYDRVSFDVGFPEDPDDLVPITIEAENQSTPESISKALRDEADTWDNNVGNDVLWQKFMEQRHDQIAKHREMVAALGLGSAPDLLALADCKLVRILPAGSVNLNKSCSQKTGFSPKASSVLVMPSKGLIRLQSACRRVIYMKKRTAAASTIQSACGRYLKKRTAAASSIQSACGRYLKKRTAAASSIQSACRRYMKKRTAAAEIVQAACRHYLNEKTATKENRAPTTAKKPKEKKTLVSSNNADPPLPSRRYATRANKTVVPAPPPVPAPRRYPARERKNIAGKHY